MQTVHRTGLDDALGIDRVLPALAGDEVIPVLAADCGSPDPDLGAVDDVGLPVGAEMVDDLGQTPQAKTGAHSASAIGEQRS
ncbi:hypothetical protein [Streptomyces sp. NPDC002671]